MLLAETFSKQVKKATWGFSGNKTIEVKEEANRTQIYVALQPLVALIAGILIVMIPRLLNYILSPSTLS